MKLLLLAALLAATPTHARSVLAIDGDTLNVDGERIRIIGLDTPETYHAKCESEREAGHRATARLRGMIANGSTRIYRQRRTDGRIVKDRYGRTLARVYIGGKNVATVLIGEGLARPNHGERRQPWC